MMGMMMRMIIGRVNEINTETIIGTGWKRKVTVAEAGLDL